MFKCQKGLNCFLWWLFNEIKIYDFEYLDHIISTNMLIKEHFIKIMTNLSSIFNNI